ncbi:hypothetical protein ACJ41O_012592 [Fusarium nematophilum]
MGLLRRLFGRPPDVSTSSGPTDSTSKPYKYEGPKIPQKPLTPREIEEMHAKLHPENRDLAVSAPPKPLYDPSSGRPLFPMSLDMKFSATPTHGQEQSSLFSLPREVRLRIWYYAMGSQKLYLTAKDGRLVQADKMNELGWWPKRGLLNLPMVCRAAYIETIACLYSGNTFCVGFGHQGTKLPLTSLETMLPPQHIASIRHVEVGWHFIRGCSQYYDSHPQAWDLSITICAPDGDEVWNEFCAKLTQLSNLKTLKIVVWTSGDLRAQFMALEKDTLAPLMEIDHLEQFSIFLPWLKGHDTAWQDAPFSISRSFEDRRRFGWLFLTAATELFGPQLILRHQPHWTLFRADSEPEWPHEIKAGFIPDSRLFGYALRFSVLPLGPRIMPVSITKQLLAVASWSSTRLDLISIGADNAIYHQSRDGSKWQSSWDSLGGSFAAVAPTVVSWGSNRLDAFARDRETDRMMHNSWSGKAWQTSWEELNTETFTGSFAAASWARDRLDVFGRGEEDRALYHQSWNGQEWQSEWENHGGTLTSELSVTSWSKNRLDIFSLGTDDALWHLSFDDDYGWATQWEGLDGVFASAPAATCWGEGRIDIFGIGTDYAVYQKYWDGAWSDFYNFGGSWVSPPAVVSWATGRLDVFVLGEDYAVYHLAYEDDVGWQAEWESLGGPFNSPPLAVSREQGTLNVFATDSNGRVWHREWDGSRWIDWEGLGIPQKSKDGDGSKGDPPDSNEPDMAIGTTRSVTGTATLAASNGLLPTGGDKTDTADKSAETGSENSASLGNLYM